MTLANTCHANNMMQDLKKATYAYCSSTKAFWIAMVQCSIVVIWKNWIPSWNLKVAMLNE